ncbi:carbohydrate kinase family protein [Chloroflexota bacterium]
MNCIEVVGLGALNMDYICQVESILGDGETAVDIEHVERTPGYGESERKWMGSFPGGSAANTIYGLAKLGVSTGFIGAVGDDAEGKRLRQDFEQTGVDTSQIKVKPKAETGLARCFSDKLNFRSIQVTPGANSRLSMDDLNLDYIKQSKMLHISSFVDDAQLEVLLELVNKLDYSVKIGFSPGELYATKGVRTLTPILSRTHVLFANEKEVEQLTGKDFKTGAEVCLNLGCQIVVVTLGKGISWKTIMATSYIRDSQREYMVEPVNKEIISAQDTIGAGDAFAAGFLYGLLKGSDLAQCSQLGDITARFSITKMGAREGLPTFDELSRRYRELYNKEL